MSGPFTHSASQLAGTVCAMLHWTPCAFWNATPAEIAALAGALSSNGEAASFAAPLNRAEFNALMEHDSDG